MPIVPNLFSLILKEEEPFFLFTDVPAISPVVGPSQPTNQQVASKKHARDELVHIRETGVTKESSFVAGSEYSRVYGKGSSSSVSRPLLHFNVDELTPIIIRILKECDIEKATTRSIRKHIPPDKCLEQFEHETNKLIDKLYDGFIRGDFDTSKEKCSSCRKSKPLPEFLSDQGEKCKTCKSCRNRKRAVRKSQTESSHVKEPQQNNQTLDVAPLLDNGFTFANPLISITAQDIPAIPENQYPTGVVIGDGNCCARSILLATTGSQENYAELRHNVVDFILSNPTSFEEDLKLMHGSTVQEYCERMSQDQEFGDDIFVLAAALILDINIRVIMVNTHKATTTFSAQIFSPANSTAEMISIHLDSGDSNMITVPDSLTLKRVITREPHYDTLSGTLMNVDSKVATSQLHYSPVFETQQVESSTSLTSAVLHKIAKPSKAKFAKKSIGVKVTEAISTKKRKFCEHNRQRYYCVDCKGGGICEHNKRRSKCVDCDGSGICEHKKERYYCVDCKGGGICEHNKRRFDCVDCDGSGICEHNKRRFDCVDCDGSGICEHNKSRSKCVDCDGSGICEHKKERYYCVDCKGGGICEHKKERRYCVDCDGSGICEHNKRRFDCVDCDGSGICEHKKERRYCVDCDGSGICEHKKERRHCVDCDGSGICEHKKERYFCVDCKGGGICEHNKRRFNCVDCDGGR
ncbi:hypothetical protein BDR26DRAFT_262622 [Obelidium mucronatum]|nr:hypothetical protein BDR26DRAFT_262622 [Obelidium mucronatum]